MPAPQPGRPLIIVEEDPFLCMIGVVLDPDTPPERVAAFADFYAHDEPDFLAWCAQLRAAVPVLWPAAVRHVETEAELLAALPSASAVVVEGLHIGARELGSAPKLRAVHKYGIGLRNIDRAACEAAGVRVLTIRRRANISCAEHAFALMLMLVRRLDVGAGVVTPERMAAQGRPFRAFDRRHTPNSNWGRLPGLRNLHAATLGLIGLGEIGREIATRAAAFDMRIVYHQRTRLPASEEQALKAQYLGLDALLRTADVVVPQLPASASTRGMIDAGRLALMKRHAIIVNVSRPDVVDRRALLTALQEGRLGGLALDPPYDVPTRQDDPLLALPNVILSPQLAGSPRRNALDDFDEMIHALAAAIGTRGP